MIFKNRSEEYVFNIARRSFLSLWSYANPQQETKGKELCDVLTMFDDNVAIFSVKDVTLKSKAEKDVERWKRRAIEKSVKQIYGAERWIRSATHIIRSDGVNGLPLPQTSDIKIHRLSISLGSEGKALILSRDYGKGFVHIFDEDSFQIILTEIGEKAKESIESKWNF